MDDKNERRQDLRAPISLPIKVKTPQGIIRGRTANISSGGLALLLFREMPSVDSKFQITLYLPDHYEMELTCEKRWSGEMELFSVVYTAIGVQFIYISDEDRDRIVSLVKSYCV